MSYICKKCGHELAGDALFCSKCGEKVTIDEQIYYDKDDVTNFQTESTEQIDIYKQLKDYEQAGKDNTAEYYKLLKREKKSYFWSKVLGFELMVIWYFLVQILFGDGGIGIKLLKFCILSFIYAIPAALIFMRLRKLTGIKVGFTLSSLFANKTKKDEEIKEKEMQYFIRCMKERHSGACRTVKILMIITLVVTIIYFAICIGMKINFLESLQLALMLLCSIGAIIYGIWAFKFVILILLIIGVILSLFSDGKGISSYPINTKVSQSVSSQTENTCVTINSIRLDKYNGKKIIVVSYSWTNTTDSQASAIYNIAIHAYQNNIELERAYFTDADDELLSRNIKPGVTVDLEKAFYLDDLDTDVLVEATPWIALHGEVYVNKTFTINIEQESRNEDDRASWEYDDYVRYYGIDPADYGYMWYNEIRNGPLDEFFEWTIEEISTQTNGSRLYEINNPWEANLTPDDFIGTWETDNGLVFTINIMDGQYIIDLSENYDMNVLGGQFSENTYNIDGKFCGMSGFNGLTSFSVSYQYSSDYPVTTWLLLEVINSSGDTITDVVTLNTNISG